MHGDSHSPSSHGFLCNAGAGAAAGVIAGDTSMLVGRDQDEAPGPWTAEAPKGKSEREEPENLREAPLLPFTIDDEIENM
ncbi:hypothetical protein QJS10_CPA05g00296 [Acorus calamus]|uniref:Uncharacterized protein n=1 Tax=Acorus calamus TaxID=4465 RepID=A0AAV9EUD6_ACOCL|nr:hypothetical protein QJS10_CPA05g00296 [Acorus calamus]